MGISEMFYKLVPHDVNLILLTGSVIDFVISTVWT